MFTHELWAKTPVGILLTMMVMLISWCVWTSYEAKADFSLSARVCGLKEDLVEFTRRLRGERSGSRSDVGGAGDGNGRGEIEMLSRSGTVREAFNRLRTGVSTSPTFVNQTGSNGCDQDTTTVETSVTYNSRNVPESAV